MLRVLSLLIILSLFSFNIFADESKQEVRKNVKEGLNTSLDKRNEENSKKRFKKKPCNIAENCNLKYCKNKTFCIERKPCDIEQNCKYKHCKNTDFCIEKKSKKVKKPVKIKNLQNPIDNSKPHKKKKSKTRKIVEKGVEFTLLGVDALAPPLLSLSTSYHFQHWAPEHISGATIDTNTLNYFKFSLKTLKDFFSIDYETSFGGTSLLKQKELIELRSNSKETWEKLVANLELPITFNAGAMKFRIYFAYSSEIFLSTLTLNEDKEYGASDNNGTVMLNKGDLISSQTKFQDFFLGVKTNSILKRFGFFHTRYTKPYSFNTGEEQVDKYIFDSLFTAYGLFVDLNYVFKNFHFGAKFKFGLGDTELAGVNLSIGDVLAQRGSDYTLQYFDSILSFGYKYSTLYDVVKLYIMSELRYRKFFLKENVDDDLVDENGDPIEGDTIHFNGDLILNISAGFSINF